MFIGTPPPDYRNIQPPARFEQGEASSDNMSTPIAVALFLSIFLFVLCIIFVFSPIGRHRDCPPKPLDLEDAYFVDDDSKRRFSPFSSPFSYTSSKASKKLNQPKNTYFSFTPPPPAYTSRPGSPASSFDDWSFSSLLARVNSRADSSVKNSRGKTWFSKLSIPIFFSRRRRATYPSPRIPISKPVPQPETPLPGPEVLTEPETSAETTITDSDTPFIRPCIGKSVSDHILHPSVSDLHTPSQAHVHDRGTFSVAPRNLDSQYLSAADPQRASAPLTRMDSRGSMSSVTSSMIGIAF